MRFHRLLLVAVVGLACGRGIGASAERVSHRHRHRPNQSRAAGRDGHGDQPRHRCASGRRQRCRTASIVWLQLPPGTYRLQAELAGFSTVTVASVELLVGQNATVRVRDEPGAVERIGDGHRRIAVCRHGLLAGWRQRRSPADGGAAAAGPQLDRAVEHGQGHHRQQHRQHARRGRRHVPAQSRWPADHAEDCRVGIRAAALQPRGDCRIPDRHQPVRHHAGPLGRRAGAGDFQVGHQHQQRQHLRLLPRRQVQRAPTRWPSECCLTRINRSAARLAGRSCATRCTTSRRTNTSASRARSSAARRRCPGRPSPCRTRTGRRVCSRAWTISSPRNSRLSIRGSRWTWEQSVRARRQRASVECVGADQGGHQHPRLVVVRPARAATRFIRSEVGCNNFDWTNAPLPEMEGSPQYDFPGLTIGAPYNFPQHPRQNNWEGRYDLTWNKGRHDIKIGVEYLHVQHTGDWYIQSIGRYTMSSVPSNLGTLIPAERGARPVAVESGRPQLRDARASIRITRIAAGRTSSIRRGRPTQSGLATPGG